MNEHAMDNGEVYQASAAPVLTFNDLTECDTGLSAGGTDTITFTTTTSASSDGLFWIDGSDTTFFFDGETQFTFGDPIEDMKSVVSKLAGEFLERYR